MDPHKYIFIFLISVIGVKSFIIKNYNEISETNTKLKIDGILIGSHGVHRSKRQTIEEVISPVTKIFVDSLINTLKPGLGSQTVYLEAFKPLLVSLGSGFIKELIKFLKGILDQGPFIDAKTFTDNTYEAFPVFIPSYGAFILLSKAGTVDLLKHKTESGNDVQIDKSNCTNCDVLEMNSIANSSVSNETLNRNSTEATKRSNTVTAEVFDKNKSYYIGEAHLIPINGKTETFESSRQVEDAYKIENDNGSVREYMRKITDTSLNIKSFKKRLLLSLVKKIENAVRNL